MSVLLSAVNLVKAYKTGKRRLFKPAQGFNAVDGISLDLVEGETLGIVGESGCGKSTLSRLLLGLASLDGGEVFWKGQNLATLSAHDWRALRQDMQLVYQDAAGALDPRMTIRAQVEEPLRIHKRPLDQAASALEAVGLGGAMADRYPHELSGGQVQRVVIARALTLDPKLMVLDEPVSALDVSIQAQIVNLLRDLQRERQLTYVFVSHDIGVVRYIATRIVVMYLGHVVEIAAKADFYKGPRHPYAQALLAAVPSPDPDVTHKTIRIGDPPNPAHPPSGCRFHPRCQFATDQCRRESPMLRRVGSHQVACHHAQDLQS